MYEQCSKKQDEIKKLFEACTSEESKYAKIIELGRKLAPLDDAFKIACNKVSGCQSNMYLHSFKEGEKIFYKADSDALISAGLAALLLNVYSGETAETILKCPPNYLEELGISASLTPNRANGLYSIHLRMKQDALQFLLKGS
ncbi:hypothetical protein PHSC3_001018 [Chlamydiales bacterium STE3]|nr:hypothetical protein PHSC3_001018 [Chlamydiales bacterium STE3]